MKKWTGAFQIAAVYVGTVIGAGFATGREIVEFFTRFGFIGFFTILISGYIFMYLGAKIMIKSIEIQANSYEEFNEHIFGTRMSKIMNIFTMIMLIGVCAVMISGAEALFVEQLGLSRSIGAFITSFLAFIIMAIGVQGLIAVNSVVVPLLILFNLILFFSVISGPNFLTNFLYVPADLNVWKPALSAISYSSFNLALAYAVLVPIATEVNDVKIVKLGGVIGGALLTMILLSSHAILTYLIEPIVYDIPMAIIVNQVAKGIFFIYVLIIYGEIFTSVIGNIYGLERQIHRYIHVNSLWIYGGILVIVYLISQINYSTLLGFLYPIFGYVSLLLIFLLWREPMRK